MILLVCHGRGDAVPERVRDTHQRRATPQRRYTKVVQEKSTKSHCIPTP